MKPQRIFLKRKKSTIKLSLNEVNHIVSEWYTNGMYSDVLQDENGLDLEEILNIDYSVKLQTK